jgi:hypothetical protein
MCKFHSAVIQSHFLSNILLGNLFSYTLNLDRAVAQQLDAGFPPRRPGFASGQHVGFVVDKAALG